MSNILVIVPWRSSFAYLYCLEYAINMRKAGNVVYFLDLTSEAAFSQSRLRWYLESFSVKNSFPKIVPRILESNGIMMHNLKDFRSEYSKNMNAESEQVFQKALRSQYAGWYGDSSIKIEDLPTVLVDRARKTFSQIYSIVEQAIEFHKIDQVATVNGRFVPDAACVLAAIDKDLEYRLFESKDSAFKRMSIFSISPHSVIENRMFMNKVWSEAVSVSLEMAQQVAKSAIDERLSPDWIWKTKNSYIPDLSSGPYIAFFPTSDVEFAVFESSNELKWKLNQTEVFKLVATKARENGLKLIVRVHPQISGQHRSLAEGAIWEQLCSENGAVCIGSEDSMDSIALARGSKLNIVFASSIALEIGFLGLPILVTCPTLYSGLIPECEALDGNQIMDAIDSPRTLDDIESIYPALYYEKMGGKALINFDVGENLNYAKYKGVSLDEPRLWVFRARKIASLFVKYVRSIRTARSAAPRSNI